MKLYENRKILIILLIFLIGINGFSVYYLIKVNFLDVSKEKNIIDYIEYEEDEKEENIDNDVILDNSQELNNNKKEDSVVNDTTTNNNVISNNNLTNNTKPNPNNNTSQKNEETKPNYNPSPKKEVISATKEYYCTGDYTLVGTKCTYTLSSDALMDYYCDSGTLNGAVCKIQQRTPLVNRVSNWCVNNGLAGSGSCPRTGCNAVGGIYDDNEYRNNSNSIYWCYSLTEKSVPAKSDYYCPNGFSLNGDKCSKYYETDAPFKYTCPSGYILVGTNCEK